MPFPRRTLEGRRAGFQHVLDALPARQVLDNAMTEREFMSLVIELARRRGWKHQHQYDSRRSVEGWPDLALLRNGHLIFLELKSQHGVVTAAQQQWIDDLRGVPAVLAFVFRPSDWAEIEELLR